MQQGKCPKCGSLEVIPNVFIWDRGHRNNRDNLQLIVEENPDAWILKGAVQTSLKAWVCGECGYAELYAKNPQALLAAHKKQMGEADAGPE